MVFPATSRTFVIRGGRIIDPAAARDHVGDLAIHRGRIIESDSLALNATSTSASSGTSAASGHGGTVVEIDARGWLVCPGLIDMHVHLREPGGEHKETLASGCAAAVAGGFTTVACMPNTQPPIDEVDIVNLVRLRAERTGLCRVHPIAAITRGRKGRRITDFAALKEAGVLALSDDGDGVEDDEVMRSAGREARRLNLLLIQHCEYHALSAGGVMHAGPTARRLGVPGWDARAEEAMIERDLRLVEEIGFRYHAAHISTAIGVEMIRRAKQRGLPVSTEVCPHHLLLTDEHCADLDPNFKMNPPLRSAADVAACVDGLVDGTIDCVVTDHAPHTVEEKEQGFTLAPFGIVGLETALPLAAQAVVHSGRLTWSQLIDRMCCRPARVLGLEDAGASGKKGLFVPGAVTDLTLIDPDATWIIDPSRFLTHGRNSPFAGWTVRGRVMATFVDGRGVFVHDDAKKRFMSPSRG